MQALKKAIFMIITISLFAGCAGNHTSESTGQYLDSVAVTTKVKAKLVENLGKQGFGIQVKTFKDEVQLSGFVNSESVKAKADKLAQSVPNVRRVINNITVK